MQIPKRITIDAHNDTLMKITCEQTGECTEDLGKLTQLDVDLVKMVSGDVNVAMFAAFTEDFSNTYLNNNRLLAMMRVLEQTAAQNSEVMTKVNTKEELINALSANKHMAIQTIEGAYGIDASNYKALLRQYSDLGVRMITLVWNHSNALGEGMLKTTVDGIPTQGGLTTLGKQVVAEMEQLDIFVDVSHMDEETFWSTFNTATKPLIASHSGAYALKAHARNLKDDQLKAIAETGGVINVVFCQYFLGDEIADVEVLLDHIHHIVQVAGIDHVGLGSDFDGATMPNGLNDMSDVPLIAKGLLRRGYDEAAVNQIMGGNMFRLLSAHMPGDKAQQPTCMRHQLKVIGKTVTASIVHENIENIRCYVNGIAYPFYTADQDKTLSCTIEPVENAAFYAVTLAYDTVDKHAYRLTDVVKINADI